MDATPDEVDAAVQQLEDTCTPGIDRRIVAEVLGVNPNLVHTAREWGWSDTEVRDGLFVCLWSHLTGGDPNTRIGELERNEQIYEAQRTWLATNGLS
jgi:hypothetical protein